MGFDLQIWTNKFGFIDLDLPTWIYKFGVWTQTYELGLTPLDLIDLDSWICI